MSNQTQIQPVETGVIHGRFQILHHDHMKYLMAGKALCSHLVIGITNPDPGLTRKEQADPERDNPYFNPLTFYERYLLIKAAMQAEKVPLKAFSIVPFPINLPALYHHYVPMDALFFLSIYDDWGRKKLSYFKSINLDTYVLWEVPPEQKGISAGTVRELIVQDKPWKHLVPPVVADLLEAWRIRDRLIAVKNL